MAQNKWGWNPKKFFLVGVFTAATFAVSFVLGSAITLAFGPGTSGIFTIIITTILVVICARLVESKGVFTLMVTLYTLLAIPTNMFGPPGPHKIIIGFITGLVYDLVWEAGGRKKWSLPIAAAISTSVSLGLIFVIMTHVGYPKAQVLGQFLKYFIPLYALLGFIGGKLGNDIYDKSLSGLSVFKILKN